MPLLCAYLLESSVLSDAELAARYAQVRELVTEWLRVDKEVDDPWADAGDFDSSTRNGRGRFERQQVIGPIGALEEVRLEEFTRAGQVFTTYVATVAHAEKLRVYCTLNVANAEGVVTPLSVDPRCPSVVRAVLGAHADWCLSHSPLPLPRPCSMTGEAGGRRLADEIRDVHRILPIIVVSAIDGEFLWPRLPDELAFDLAGLAKVVSVDDEATWALSDGVGKLHSCYKGAVRLYWPARLRSDGGVFFNSSVWTASVLLSNDRDGKGCSRFRSMLRRTLMSTAASSIAPPPAIREIQDAGARSRIEALARQAAPDAAALAEARRYAQENQALKSRIEQLQDELAKANACAAVRGRP